MAIYGTKKANDFIKINEEFYSKKVEKDEDIFDYLVDKVKDTILLNVKEDRFNYELSLLECESPIEQLLSINLERIGLINTHIYNPFVDVKDIERQVYIHCENSIYRLDFLIPVEFKFLNNKSRVVNFVIECDGHEFHQKTKEQVKKDNKRQRDLQLNGYEIIRFSGSEIWGRAYRCAVEIKNIILNKWEKEFINNCKKGVKYE